MAGPYVSNPAHKSAHYKYVGGDGFEAMCRVLWLPKDPDRIRFMVSGDEFMEPDGSKPGIQIAWVGSNLKSADYNPRYFNRAARWLAMHDMPAPEEVPEHSRYLSKRVEFLLK